MFNFKLKSFKKFDFVLFITMAILCIYGLVILKSATLSYGTNSYMKSQIIAIIIGLLAIAFLVLLDYSFLGKMYLPIYFVCILLLVAVLLFGFGEDDWGARSWLQVGPVSFQPSEFVKIGLVISLAKYIDNNKDKLNEPFTLLKVLAFAGLPVALILLQPDAGTALVFIFFIAIMLFVAGIKWKYIGMAVLAGLAALPILWFRLDDYQRDRFFDFLEPERNPTGTGYQALQGKIAIGSGKIFGRGLFQGSFTQFEYIPEKQTDFIFAVLVEELGFIGGVSLIGLYFILISRLIRLAKNSKDLFGSLMVIGIAAIFVFHIWENIGMTIGLMPITGIPLPFISHGGTFMLVNMIGIGICLSVGLRREALTFHEK
ncbi:MAG: rod shape-determining protein RodA [Tissierellaceae bacterium]|jgi:rod shape determining protein RodA|nr:rod shape-determining protein RodA [Tissierellia bacterium]